MAAIGPQAGDAGRDLPQRRMQWPRASGAWRG
jgi:hypothetical protein